MENLADARLRLLLGKTWRYLRYLHLREALSLTTQVKSFLTIGCGNALAELALAIENPTIGFIATDINDGKEPSHSIALELAQRWRVRNIRFDTYDVLQPFKIRADFVATVEVLEHLEQDGLAASNMLKASRRYVFSLVPFADKVSRANKVKTEHALRLCGHQRLGYDHETLTALFPAKIHIRGCYWADAGRKFREHLSDLTELEIRGQQFKLAESAAADVRVGIPLTSKDADGIWILSGR